MAYKHRIKTGIQIIDGLPADLRQKMWASRADALAGIVDRIEEGVQYTNQRQMGMLIPVKDGISQSLYWFKDGIEDSNFIKFVQTDSAVEDALIFAGATISPAGDSITLDGTKWRISNIDYLLALITTFTIPAPDPSGLIRIDNVIADYTGNVFYQMGTPDETAVAPDVPYKNILVTTIISSLADGIAEQPAPVILDGTLLFGSTNPVDGLGKNGDSFLHVINGSFWTKENGSWLLKYTPPAVDLSGVTAPENVTYAQLVAKVNASTLVPGKSYRISDYQTVHTILGTAVINTGPVEPLIVVANDLNSLDDSAMSETFPEDEITYSIANTALAGATKGVILGRRDTKTNVFVSNDWRNIKYRRYKFNPPIYSDTTTYAKYTVVIGSDNAIYASVADGNIGNIPSVNSDSWYQLIQNNHLYYMGNQLTGQRLLINNTSTFYGGGTYGTNYITIPVDSANFIDVVMFQDYSSKFNNIKINGQTPGTNTSLTVFHQNQSSLMSFSEFGLVSSQSTIVVDSGAGIYQFKVAAFGDNIMMLKQLPVPSTSYIYDVEFRWLFSCIVNTGNLFRSRIGTVESCVIRNNFEYNYLTDIYGVIAPNVFREVVGKGLANIRFNSTATVKNLVLSSNFGREYLLLSGNENSPYLFNNYVVQALPLIDKAIIGKLSSTRGTSKDLMIKVLAELATNDTVNIGQIKLVDGLKITTNDVIRIDGKKALFEGDLTGYATTTAVGVEDILYADLVTKVTANGLTPGKKYRITDYQTIHTITGTASTNTGPIEPLIVTANDVNSLESFATSETFPEDEIQYTISNTALLGATKGVILGRRDTITDVFVSNDWRNITYRRYKFNPAAYSAATTYAKYNVVLGADNAIYASAIDGNIGNTPAETSDAWYQLVKRNDLYYYGNSASNTIAVNNTASLYGGGAKSINVTADTTNFIDSVIFPNYSNTTNRFLSVKLTGTIPGNTTPTVFFNNAQSSILKYFEVENVNNTYNTFVLHAGDMTYVKIKELGGVILYSEGFVYRFSAKSVGNVFANIKAIVESHVNTIYGTIIRGNFEYNTIQDLNNVILPNSFRQVSGQGLSNIRFNSTATVNRLHVAPHLGFEYNTTGGYLIANVIFSDLIVQSATLVNKSILGEASTIRGEAKAIVEKVLLALVTNDVVQVTNKVRQVDGLTYTATDIIRIDGKKALFEGDVAATDISGKADITYVNTQDTALGVRIDSTNATIAKKQNVAGYDWILRDTPAIVDTASFQDIAYGNGIFVATSIATTGTKIMTSNDGVNWVPSATPVGFESSSLRGIIYGNGVFVIVANKSVSSTTPDTNVAYSRDGLNWTVISTPDHYWLSVTFGKGLFVAVSSGSSTINGKRIMTSPDAITWTVRDTPTPTADLPWQMVTYGNDKFVVVGGNGTTGCVMYSTDAITWTVGTPANQNWWTNVIYANGLFVSTSSNATGGANTQVMTSVDGITWTARTTPGTTRQWNNIAYGNGLFVTLAESSSAREILTSTDGITWTLNTNIPGVTIWTDLIYANGIFVAVGRSSGTTGYGHLVMTSGAMNEQTPIYPISSIDKPYVDAKDLILDNKISALGIVDTTYANLVSMISGSTLIKGARYRITDFQTVHNIPQTSPVVLFTSSVIEPLVFTANSTNTLESAGYSELWPKDIVYYSTTNASGSTKGIITRRIDTSTNVDVCYDFRYVVFRRWKMNPIAYDSTAAIARFIPVLYNNAIYVVIKEGGFAAGTATTPSATSDDWFCLIPDNTLNFSSTRTYWQQFMSGDAAFVKNIRINIDNNTFTDHQTFQGYNTDPSKFSNITINYKIGAPGAALIMNIFLHNNQAGTIFNNLTFDRGAVFSTLYAKSGSIVNLNFKHSFTSNIVYSDGSIDNWTSPIASSNCMYNTTSLKDVSGAINTSIVRNLQSVRCVSIANSVLPSLINKLEASTISGIKWVTNAAVNGVNIEGPLLQTTNVVKEWLTPISNKVFVITVPTANANDDVIGNVFTRASTEDTIIYPALPAAPTYTPISPESIPFTGATGTVTIDFNVNSRLTKYGTNPLIVVYELVGNVKTFYSFGASYDTSTNILTIDGVNGDRTVVIR